MGPRRPGQHDLLYHNYEDLHKSPFHTLVEAGVITLLEPGKPLDVGTLRLYGFPWKAEVIPLEEPPLTRLTLEIAVIHAFVWTKHTGYHGAEDSRRLRNWYAKLQGYDFAIFGDNHKPFHVSAREGKPCVVNCGSLMRRHSDQKDYQPAVWLIHENGTAYPHYLDISEDVVSEVNDEIEIAEEHFDASEFMEEVKGLEGPTADFAEVLLRVLDTDSTDERVALLIKEMLKKREKQ